MGWYAGFQAWYYRRGVRRCIKLVLVGGVFRRGIRWVLGVGLVWVLGGVVGGVLGGVLGGVKAGGIK